MSFTSNCQVFVGCFLLIQQQPGTDYNIKCDAFCRSISIYCFQQLGAVKKSFIPGHSFKNNKYYVFDKHGVVSPEALAIINEQLFDNEAQLDNLVLDMSRITNGTYEELNSYVSIIRNTFLRF